MLLKESEDSNNSEFTVYVDVCESLETIRKVLTPERLRILNIIKEKKPRSIYELAKILKRNRSSVIRDLKCLHAFGLVEFVDSGSRNKKRPVVKYERIKVVVFI